jgi:hypothetical protein
MPQRLRTLLVLLRRWSPSNNTVYNKKLPIAAEVGRHSVAQ